MSLSTSTINGIKSIIQKFIDENGFNKYEEHVQTYYTTKILEILGWNSSNCVINEPQEVKTGNKPDILLKGSGGGTIFIIESKAPDKSLDGKYLNKTFKEQVCEYCNSEGIYWGVLTNFVEWRIYNSYTKELYYNKKYFTIVDNKVNEDNELFDFFEKITFTSLNTAKGKIDSNPIYYKKQEEIKDEFFTNLKLWRQKLRNYLFNQFKNRKDQPIPEAIEKLTQKILDRLIFMEVCNDKNIISYDILGSVLYSKRNKYEELKVKFQELDEKFNSDLFAQDMFCDTIRIDDDPMEEVIRGINSIDFSKLSVHIIGEVYENYLGELLRKGKKEIKFVESKERAKRKSQGIYYTPDYIVNYIVENTLGKILRNCNTEKEIENIRVLDPACGSGSFLIRAFDELYNAYKRCITKMQLFDEFEIKKKILLYNLYGVDLDERAVDIAKLNLLIKALEGTTEGALMGRKLLPNLSLNIRCGNSLVSGKSMMEKDEGTFFDITEQYKKDIDTLIELKQKFRHAIEDKEKEKLINEVFLHEEKINSYLNKDLKNYFKNVEEVKPFNYEVAFCETFKDDDKDATSGGFDCVVGNPPYGIVFNPKVKYFFDKKYISFKRNNDLYSIFIEKSLSLLNQSGSFSFIVPNTFLIGEYFNHLKRLIFDVTRIIRILDFGINQVFEDPNVFNCIIVLKKENIMEKRLNNDSEIINISKLDLKDKSNFKTEIFKQSELSNLSWKPFEKLVRKLLQIGNKLEDIAFVKDVGLNYWTIGRGKTRGDSIASRIFYNGERKNKKDLPFLKGRDIDRYICNEPQNWLKCNYDSLLNPHKDIFRFSPDFLFQDQKILYRQTADNIIATIDTNKYLIDKTLHLIVLRNKTNNLKLQYLLGLINSKLLNYIYMKISMEEGRTFAQVKTFRMKKLPIRKIDFKNKQEKFFHDKFVILVDEMLKLNKQPEKNEIKIKAKDKEINELVYKLYGLTEEEINVVEGHTSLS